MSLHVFQNCLQKLKPLNINICCYTVKKLIVILFFFVQIKQRCFYSNLLSYFVNSILLSFIPVIYLTLLIVLCWQNLLPPCHSANAAYLFQQDKFYDVSYDTGDKSIQCGRKNDSLKLWLMWKAKGDQGFERDIDNLFECSR